MSARQRDRSHGIVPTKTKSRIMQWNRISKRKVDTKEEKGEKKVQMRASPCPTEDEAPKSSRSVSDLVGNG